MPPKTKGTLPTFAALTHGALFHFAFDDVKGEPPLMKVQVFTPEGAGMDAYADFVTGYVWSVLPHEVAQEVEPWTNERVWWLLGAPEATSRVVETHEHEPEAADEREPVVARELDRAS